MLFEYEQLGVELNAHLLCMLLQVPECVSLFGERLVGWLAGIGWDWLGGWQGLVGIGRVAEARGEVGLAS